jgi:hypothetical protein
MNDGEDGSFQPKQENLHVKPEPEPEHLSRQGGLNSDDALRPISADDGDYMGIGVEPDMHEPEEPDDRQCRICFAGPEEEEAMGRLISPCLCSGSMRVS